MLKEKKFLYEQVINSTIELIRRDRYLLGEKLPSERVLADKFNCNYHTMRKAVRVLCDEGVLEQRPRLGTFVKKDARFLIGKAQPKVKIVSTRKIGVLILSGSGEYFNSLLMELECAVGNSSVQLELCTVRELNDLPNISTELKKNGCRSLIILTRNSVCDTAELKFFLEQSVLPVALGNRIAGFEKYCHEPPKQSGSFRATAIDLLCRYFSGLGCEHIAFLGGDNSRKFIDYNRYVNEHGLLSLSGFVDDTAESVDVSVRLWEKYKGTLAVICEDDMYAMRLINSLHKQNWKLPEDIAVAGFNNFCFSAFTDPPLTTIQFPFKYLAQSLIRRAIELAEGKEEWVRTLKVPQPELIIRESCGGRAIGKNILEKLIRDNETKKTGQAIMK
jgi:DNA-binding LacI/PurR family transcriptional regulator